MATVLHLPFSELLKSIPGFFGIRLEEEPRHEVLSQLDDIEIRRYAPALIAEITIPGPHDAALDEAFDRLARFIFGNNTRRDELPMTAPVYQRDGERLPMTTPVLQQDIGGAWTVSFFLSNDLAMEKVPLPHDPAIRLTTTPERLVAVVRYSGNNTDEHRREGRDRLMRWLADHPSYRANSTVHWAQYDAPFVIPFLKRNEAQVEVVPR